jgi:quercetin dioxygenase-like cupin family protein
MQITSWGKVDSEKLSETISRQMVNGEKTTVARLLFTRGALVSRHSHPNEQFTVIVAGALKFIFDDREVVARTGDIVFIASGEPHAAEALEDTESLDVFAPRREDWLQKDDAYFRR